MSEKTVYLDNNATTMVDPQVFEAMKPYFCDLYGNPSSMHEFGGQVMHAVDKAREQVKDFLGARDAKEIIFTASGSEGDNMAIRGVLEANKNKKHIITTKIEHPAVLNVYKYLEKQGYDVTYLDVDSKGNLDLNQLAESITDETALVSIMYANNETGVILPVEKAAKIVKAKNPKIKFHSDAVQAAGKIPLDVKNTDIDLLTIAGHKIHAPKGIGALYIKTGTLLPAFVIGGHQERGKRAGTENVPYIVGLGKACELAQKSLDYEMTEVKRLRDKLENGILDSIYNAKVNGSTSNRVPNTTNIGFQYIEGELILLHLSNLGICASSGSACTSGSLEPSHVLKSMGVPFEALHGSIRFSLSRFTTDDEIEYTLKVLPDVIFKLNKISPYQRELKELAEKHK
ncbi:TPA: cysteine desulfurase NifS [Candidatus Gastranaerophilales bacterium HUM_21]|nr:MAG TPA: cysteine desulfurase NifS [Candidatus Gastranaerophilales bacterium HUM_21]